MTHLLKGGFVVSGTCVEQKDVLFDDVLGKICNVADEIEPLSDMHVKDISGMLLFPGFIDGHTHFDLEVAQTATIDDFLSGTEAAICGGTTTIIDFATQNRGETLTEALKNWHSKSDGKCSCDYGFHMAISDWNDDVKKELKVLMDDGITSFKLYMIYDSMVLEDAQIYQVLKELKALGGIAGVHCENRWLIDEFVKREKEKGNLGPDSHPKTRPDIAEAEAIYRLLKIAKEVDAPVMIVHLSTKLGYEKIMEARSAGQEVYVETCPQYLVLDETCYEKSRQEANTYICSPPLRKADDQNKLWEGLSLNQIQTVATDHCSFTIEQKEMGKHDFTKTPNGMPGVETRADLLYTFGVKQDRITIEQMCRVLCEQPAKLYGLYPKKGIIAVGSDADLVIWNPNAKKILSVKDQHSKADYHPFEGVEITGCVRDVFLRGKLVVENGDMKNPLQGIYQKRGKYVCINSM